MSDQKQKKGEKKNVMLEGERLLRACVRTRGSRSSAAQRGAGHAEFVRELVRWDHCIYLYVFSAFFFYTS